MIDASRTFVDQPSPATAPSRSPDEGAVPSWPDPEMDLVAFRIARSMTWADLADLIGARDPRQARGWALGYERPSAERIDEIVRRTGGAVTVHAMHRRRLQYERSRRREVEDVSDGPAA